MEELKDFDSVLQDTFDKKKFANDLLLMTNNGQTIDNNIGNSTEGNIQDRVNNGYIDIDTSIKKINFDLNEVDKLYETILNQNSTLLINQLYNNKQDNENISQGLSQSLNFIELSYERLNNEILKPYELSHRLQSALNKIHQTSTLLRDALLYLHIVNMIKTLDLSNVKDAKSRSRPEQDDTIRNEITMLKLSSLYQQLQLTLQKNINLNSLTIIKTIQNNWIKDNKRQLVMNLSNTLYQYCNHINDKDYKGKSSHEFNQILGKISFSLYTLSTQDFNITINKYIQSLVMENSQFLISTINNLKDFSSSLNKVISNATSLIKLQEIFNDIVIDSLTQKNLVSIVLLKNSVSSSSSSSTQAIQRFQDIYWIKISQLFKKELEIAFKRGGPVGKNLQKNKTSLIEIMNKLLKDDTVLQIMLKTLSIMSSS